MSKSPSIVTPIKRARGLGSAHSGVHHFWVLRVSAVALIPLSVWFMIELITHLLGTQAYAVADWLRNPVPALLLAAFIVAGFWHAKLGMQEVFEDYIHCKAKKLFALLTLNTLIYGLGAASLMAIARFHFFSL